MREDTLNKRALNGNSAVVGLSSYRDLLKEKGYFDYSSIMEEAVDALRTHAGVRTKISARVKAVIVDEYQDVNPLQERLIAEMHKLGAAVKIVGDDDQTIYQWRGSDVSNITRFTDRYSPATTIRLEENFRSSEGIINVARIVIEKNTDRLPKAMISTGAQTYEAGDISALEFESPEAEAEYIANTCKALSGTFINENGGQRAISWSDMAVLVRVIASAEPIRNALKRARIPFVSVGMNTLFELLPVSWTPR